MRTLVHLSDLHFGSSRRTLVEPLLDALRQIRPSLIAVSGDLTQRARASQFMEARAFIDSLPGAKVVVPGNHDVPMYRFWERFLSPLGKFRRYITDDLEPFYGDEELVVVGVNTAHGMTTKYGRVGAREIGRIRERLCSLPDEVVKVVVTHHPFDLPEGHDVREIVGRAAEAMEALAACGADLLLAGHMHLSSTGRTAVRYKTRGHSALFVQAGTATSTRGRGESNSFNVIRVRHPHVQVERRVWKPEAGAFLPSVAETFAHTPDGWERLPDETAAGILFDEESTPLQPSVPAGQVGS